MEDGGWFLKPLFLLLFKYTMGPNYIVGFDFLVQCKLDELKKMKTADRHNKKLISRVRSTTKKSNPTLLFGPIVYLNNNVRFLLETFVKDILSQRTKIKTVTEL